MGRLQRGNDAERPALPEQLASNIQIAAVGSTRLQPGQQHQQVPATGRTSGYRRRFDAGCTTQPAGLPRGRVAPGRQPGIGSGRSVVDHAPCSWMTTQKPPELLEGPRHKPGLRFIQAYPGHAGGALGPQPHLLLACQQADACLLAQIPRKLYADNQPLPGGERLATELHRHVLQHRIAARCAGDYDQHRSAASRRALPGDSHGRTSGNTATTLRVAWKFATKAGHWQGSNRAGRR